MSRSEVETARGTWTPPGALQRRAILRGAKTIAVVGASSKPNRASHFVLSYLRSSSTDYEVWPVSPGEDEILGPRSTTRSPTSPARPTSSTSSASPTTSRRWRRRPWRGAGTLWIQLGLHSDEAVRIAHEAELDVVTNRCVKIEHARFHGGLHLAGFDTGVISSRRTRD